MAMKRYSNLCTASELQPHHKMQFRNRWGVLRLFRRYCQCILNLYWHGVQLFLWIFGSLTKLTLLKSKQTLPVSSSFFPSRFSTILTRSWWHLPVAQCGWGCRIHRLHLCRGVRTHPPPTSILDMTLNNLMVRLQDCWTFGKCGMPFHCYCSQAYSDP